MAWKPELSTTLLGKATFLMVPRAGELSAILLNHLFGHEWVGILWSFGSPGVVDLHVAVLSSNLAMAPSMMSSSPKCDFFFILPSIHPFVLSSTLIHSLTLIYSSTFPPVHSSTCPFFHSCTLPLFYLSTLPFSHSPLSQSLNLSFSHSPTLSLLHSSTLPLVQLSTHSLAHLSALPLLLKLSPCTFAEEESSPRTGMKSSHRIPPLVVYNPVRQDGICCSSLE